jgi:hypothetical protein
VNHVMEVIQDIKDRISEAGVVDDDDAKCLAFDIFHYDAVHLEEGSVLRFYPKDVRKAVLTINETVKEGKK